MELTIEDIFVKWRSVLGENEKQIKFRLDSLHNKVEHYKLHDEEIVKIALFQAFVYYQDDEKQESFTVLGKLYASIASKETKGFKPSYTMRIMLEDKILAITQSLINGGVINMEFYGIPKDPYREAHVLDFPA